VNAAAKGFAAGIELFNVAVIQRLLALFFPDARISIDADAEEGIDAVFRPFVGALRSVTLVSHVAGCVAFEFAKAGVYVECDWVAFKKVLAHVLLHDLSTLLGMGADEAIAQIALAVSHPHVPDDIELIELGARWMRDNDAQLLPFIGRARIEDFAKRAGIQYVDGESLDNIARLAWELHDGEPWDKTTDAEREGWRSISLDVIHALRAVGYAIVAPPAHRESSPPTLPTGAPL
jgi:hypothetical protein